MRKGIKFFTILSLAAMLFNTVAFAEDNDIYIDANDSSTVSDEAFVDYSSDSYEIDTDAVTNVDDDLFAAKISVLSATKLTSGTLYRIETTRGFCVVMPAGSFNNEGARATLEKKSKGRVNQWWYVLPCNKSTFMLINYSTGKALEVTGDSHENDAQVGQWSIAYPAKNQIWKLKAINRNFSALINTSSGKALDIPWCNERKGQILNQYDFNGSTAQQYKFTAVPKSEYGNYTYRAK